MTKKKVVENQHKPMIETIINTAAIALSALAVTQVQSGDYKGLILLAVAMMLEFFKYWGRKTNYW